EDRLEYVRRGRLSVRPRHADHRELIRRTVEQLRAHRPHCGPDRWQEDLGHVDRQPALDDEGRGPANDRLGSEIVSVVNGSRDAEEEEVGSHLARAIPGPGDRHVRVAAQLMSVERGHEGAQGTCVWATGYQEV